MRITKVQNHSIYSCKKHIVKNNYQPSFLGDDFEAKKNDKLSFSKKCSMLLNSSLVEVKDYPRVLLLKEVEFLRFLDFMKKQEQKTKLAFQYSKLDKRQDEIYHYLRDRSVPSKYALKATDYSSKQLNRYTQIFEEYTPGHMLDEAVKFEDKKFDRLKALIDEKHSFVSAYEVAKLDDDFYLKAINIKNKGFRLLFAADVAKDDKIYNLLNCAIDENIDMRILNAAFRYSVNYNAIKSQTNKNNLKEILTNFALINVSENALDYFDENIKNATADKKTIFDKSGKVLEHNISKRKSEIKCKYNYDKNGDIREATYSNSKKFPLALKFSFCDKRLAQITYLYNEEKIDLDIKSPEMIALFDTKFSISRFVDVLLRIESAQDITGEEFENLNVLLFGEEDEETKGAKADFKKDFPKTILLVDNSMDVKYIKRLKENLSTQPQDDIPKKIILTTLIPLGVSGEFNHGNKIAIAPDKDVDFFDVTLFHEMQHWKDYKTGIFCGQKRAGHALLYDKEIFSDNNGQILKGKIALSDNKLVISDSDLKALIIQQVSNYGTTDIAEFIAEFGAMMRKGIVGVKKENNEINYYINRKHKDARQNNCIINKDEFAKLLKFYLLVGGTPEFNANFKAEDEVISISQKEVMETEL